MLQRDKIWKFTALFTLAGVLTGFHFLVLINSKNDLASPTNLSHKGTEYQEMTGPDTGYLSSCLVKQSQQRLTAGKTTLLSKIGYFAGGFSGLRCWYSNLIQKILLQFSLGVLARSVYLLNCSFLN